MRPSGRRPMPDLPRLLTQANALLERHRLPRCSSLSTEGCDQDTANPTVIGESPSRRYVIKCVLRHPQTLARQLAVANALRASTGLPIPEHICASDAPSELPLLVMEWMPGGQLRVLLMSAEPAVVETLAHDHGRCQGRFHRAELAPELLGEDAIEGDWHRAAAISLHRRPPEHLPPEQRQRLVLFLDRRLDAVANPLRPGLVKLDDDVRDYLAETATRPRVTAMLDWERVWRGDTAHATAMVFHRLWLMGRRELWRAFRSGYAAGAGEPPRCGPQVEVYLMWRAVHAAGLHAAESEAGSRARDLIAALLDGAGLGYAA